MQIKINLKPVRVTDSNKLAVLATINSHHCCAFGAHYTNCLIPFGRFSSYADEVVRVYNLEKHNKQVSRTRKNGKTISKVVSPAHWVGHYYDIPVSLLKLMKKKVVQHNRHFELTDR